MYNINDNVIVPIDRAPQRLYSQRYSYRGRNINHLYFYNLSTNLSNSHSEGQDVE